MTADVVNLRQFRKRKSRDEKARKADERRIEFGRTKSEKAMALAVTASAERFLEGHRIESRKEPDQ